MCQATVFLGEEEVAREVTGLEPLDEGVRLTTFFEPPQVVPGPVQYIDFLKHRVQLAPLEEEQRARSTSSGCCCRTGSLTTANTPRSLASGRGGRGRRSRTSSRPQS